MITTAAAKHAWLDVLGKRFEEPTSDTEDGCRYTVEEAIEHIGFGRFQLKVMGAVGLFQVLRL